MDSEEKYEKKLQQLKKQFEIKEASIGEFKVISHHRTIEKGIQSYDNMFGDNREIYIINVKADAKGSNEVYSYSPGSYRIISSWDPYIYEPINGTISLDIRSYNLDKASIIPIIEQKIALTKVFIENNNHSIKDFNLNFPKTIELTLEEYYKKLKALYN